MRVLICGYAFWLFSMAVLFRLILTGRLREQSRQSKNILAVWAILVLGAFLLFRPHEDIFGGQDGGAYLNTAARLARDPHLSYTDPLLAVSTQEARPFFLYYGPGRPYLSKYACGRVKDLENAVCGVWFQPAYPIVASIAGRLFGLRAVLYVIPLFALFLGLALRELFSELSPDQPQCANAAAFLFYVNPLMVWHARHPRPEVIASFLLVSGMTLLLRAWRNPQRNMRWFDTAIGSAALALAPFFHITAAMVVIPAAAPVLAATLAGRREFLIHPIVNYIGFRAFIWQLQHINDTYGLLRRAPWLATNPQLQTLLVGVLCVLLLLLSFRTHIFSRLAQTLQRAIPYATSAAMLTGYSLCWLLARLNPPTKDWPPVHHYMYRTDIHALLNFISRPVGALILLGFFLMALRPHPRRWANIVVLWTLVPATLLIGNFYDFFVTRYLLVAFIPLAALALAVVLAWVAALPFRRAQALSFAAWFLLAGLLVRHRMHLIATTEYRGLQKFVASLAEPIRKENGILLFEYPRLAAPFDLMFGVPTLALHNERDDDYRLQEKSWEQILQRFPNRPAYFITPFQEPRSDLFDFLSAGSAAYTGTLLVQRRWELPTEVRDWNVHLRVYQMRLAQERSIRQPLLPNLLAFSDGNMGLRRFARVPQKPRQTDAVRLYPGKFVQIPYSRGEFATNAAEILAFLLVTNASQSVTLTLATAAGPIISRAAFLVNEWHLAHFSVPSADLLGDSVQISTDAPALLHDVLMLDSLICISLMATQTELPKERMDLQPMFTRWARQDASVCVPTATTPTYLLVFHTAPDELTEPVTITATSPTMPSTHPRFLPPGRWMWTAWPIHAQRNSTWTWVSFHAEPAFDPQMRGYPPDLITHFGWVCVTDL